MLVLTDRGSVRCLVNAVAQIPYLGAGSSRCWPRVSKWKFLFSV